MDTGYSNPNVQIRVSFTNLFSSHCSPYSSVYTFESSLAERVTRGGATSGGEAMKAPIMSEHYYVENKCENKKCPKRHPADCDFSHDTLVSDDL